MIALPPVASVGVIEVQNCSAIVFLTNANSSKYRSVIDIPRPVFSVVVAETIREPFSKSSEPLLYVVTPALICVGHASYAYLIRCIISCEPVYLCAAIRIVASGTNIAYHNK